MANGGHLNWDGKIRARVLLSGRLPRIEEVTKLKTNEQFTEKDHIYWRRKYRIREELDRRYPLLSRALGFRNLFV